MTLFCHHHFQHTRLLLFLLSIFPPFSFSSTPATTPPLPVLPLPNTFQLQWQQDEMAMFLHFGMNTFTDSEWGTGVDDPSLFNPTALSATQWAQAAKDTGFSRMVLTAKHHDGFCLWPSKYTNYSVESCGKWRDGMGDVVGEVATAAREIGVGFGIYLSPWDRHDESYEKTKEYNEFYLGQMSELLSNYGEILEVFLDGAPGGQSDTKYFFQCWFDFIHQHQPSAVIFSDSGPDSRWVGDEAGVSGSTCWSLFNGSVEMIGNVSYDYARQGDPNGHSWIPAECDVSIRPGWFWHSDEHPKSALELLEIYYKSVGRNCRLLLNVPPNSSGLISSEDIEVLHEFAAIREAIFSKNLAQSAIISASSTRGGDKCPSFAVSHVLQDDLYNYWASEENQTRWEIKLDWQELVSFNVLHVKEPIQMGQRISKFHLDVLIDDRWQTIVKGTTVGYKRLLLFPTVKTQSVKFVIDKSRADPLISYLAIHVDEFSVKLGAPEMIMTRLAKNESQQIRQLVGWKSAV